jgi:hypothetical protein
MDEAMYKAGQGRYMLVSLKKLGSEFLQHLLILREDFKMNRFRVQVKHSVVAATTAL